MPLDPIREHTRRYVWGPDDREDNHEFGTNDISLVHSKSLDGGVRRLWRERCHGDVIHILLRLRNADRSGLGLKAGGVFGLDSEALMRRTSDGSVEAQPGHQVHLDVYSKEFSGFRPIHFQLTRAEPEE